MVWLTQAIFYGAVWLPWQRGDSVGPAILLDIAHERLYLFDLVLWPEDGLLLAYLLILAATLLFFVTAFAGRLFCGFACPQTVYTMLFTWIEARVEGDHLARRRLDEQPPNARKLALKTAKHALWLLLSAWTAVSFVGYFTPIRELLPSLVAWQAGPWESFWLLFYGLFTYLQAGFAREAVCQHMCPYSRFQGVMFDPATVSVSYDARRGEPRGALRAAAGGDCVDCGICVQVCPTGIDIRDGLQYACINCGVCIDACDTVMDKVGSPRGLIRFAAEHAPAIDGAAPPDAPRPLTGRRPRLATYGISLLALVALTGWTLLERPQLRIDVERDRGTLARVASDSRIENAYRVKLSNLSDVARTYALHASGLPGVALRGAGAVTVPPNATVPLTLTLSVPDPAHGSRVLPVSVIAATADDPDGGAIAHTRFLLP